MTTASDYSDVFVSYRRTNVEFVKTLVEALRAQGKEVWIDWEDIPPGSVGFSDDIKRGLDGADTFICVLSSDYLESTYCIDLELGYAVTNKKKIIPIVYEKFEGRPVPEGIGHINWIYFTPHAGQQNAFEESFPRVIAAMETDLQHVRSHKRFMLRALEWSERERAKSYLLKGDEIVSAEKWLVDAAGKDPLPTDLHKEYVVLSRAEEERRKRLLMTGVIGALVVMAILAVFAVFQWFSADAARDTAEVALETAEVALTQEGVARATAEAAREQAEEAKLLTQSLLLIQEALDADGGSNPFLALSLVQQALQHLDPPLAEVQNAYARLIYQAGPSQAIDVDAVQTTDLTMSADEAYVVVATCQSQGTLCQDPRLLLLDSATWEVKHELPGISGQVTATAFDANSERVAAAMCASADDEQRCNNGTQIAVWDVESGELLAQWQGQDIHISVVAFSPDGQELATGSWNTTIALWNAWTGEAVATLRGHEDAVWGVAYTPDGSRILSTGCRAFCDGGDLIMWDATTHDMLQLYEQVSGGATPLVILPAGDTAIFDGRAENELTIWDIEAGRPKRPFTLERPINVRRMWLNQAGSRLVTADFKDHILVWDLEHEHSTTLSTGSNDISGVGLIGDKQVVIGFDSSPAVMLWDTDNGAIVRRFPDYRAQVQSVAYSADGTLIAATSTEAEIAVLDATSGDILHRWETEQPFILDVAISPDGTQLATAECNNSSEAGCQQGRVRIRDIATGRTLHDLVGHETHVWQVAYSADGSYLISAASSGNQHSLIVWDLATGTSLYERPFDADIAQVAFLPDGSAFVAAVGDKLMLWDMASGTQSHEFAESISKITNFTVLPDGQRIAVGEENGSVSLWDIATGQMINRVLVKSDPILSIAATGQYILVDMDRDIDMLNSTTGEIERQLQGDNHISALAVNADGSRIVSGTREGVVLWRIDTAEEMQAWAQNNRYMLELPCDEIASYLHENDYCANGG